MRVDPNLYASVNASIQQSEQSLHTAMNQLSSGRRVSKPSDDPIAFTSDLQSLAASASNDQYKKNGDAVLARAQLADSALNSVVSLLTRALSLGTEGGSGTVTSAQKAELAQQVQGVLANVVAQANTTSNGTALFAGTSGLTSAFVSDPNGSGNYIYNGNAASNQVSVSSTMAVAADLPGNTIFTNPDGDVLGSLQQTILALQSGSASDLASASAGLTAAIAHVGQIRATYGNTINQINTQESSLSLESVSLTSQQNSLMGIDIAAAATNLTQAQTAQSAVLAMAAKILPTSLLNYLQR